VALAFGCMVRRTVRIPASHLPPPTRDASAADLIALVNGQEEGIRSISATVDFEPTAGSVYSGVIREYRDVRGFILAQRPAMIRMVGQAPVIRTQVFDMVSDGEEFRLYIPPKQKFIVGKTDLQRPAKNSLENLRPQHVLDALLLPPIHLGREKLVQEEADENGRRYYILSLLEPATENQLSLRRKLWFDRSNLQIVRVQIYGPEGSCVEDIRYSGHRNFGEVTFPSRIHVRRPVEDYQLGIDILKASFNQPIEAAKFELSKPPEAQLIELGKGEEQKRPRGQ